MKPEIRRQRAPRNVVTQYFEDRHGNKLVKTNRSSNPERATTRAQELMRENRYGALTALIFFEESGKDFSNVSYSFTRDSVQTMYFYKYKPLEENK